jgi:serine/threonine protein kinase
MSTYEDKLTGRLPPQSWLRQRYLIIGLAGRGGMSAVYKGVDTQQGNRTVAIKEMSQGHLSEVERQEAVVRFQQEYRMLSMLKHPNLPRIVDWFEEGDRFYFVMDFIEGKTLYEILKDNSGHPLPIGQVTEYAMQLCDVLSYLHMQQPPIIFRDLKPTNIMIRPDGRLFLIDFGIARLFKEGQAQDTVLLGSPGYAPPEQHGTAQTNPRSDIYALGATLHFALTGNDPFHSTQRFMFQPVRHYNPLVPADLDVLVLRMLSLDERGRPASAQEVKQALLAIQGRASDATSNLAPVSSPASAPTQYAQPIKPSAPVQQSYQPTVSSASPSFAAANPGGSSPAATQPAQPRAAISNRRSTGSTPWSGKFLALFIAMLALTMIGSIVAFNIPHPYGIDHLAGLDHAVELALALIFVVEALAACAFVRGAFNIAILFVSALAMVVSAFAFLVQMVRDINQFQSPAFLSPLDPLPFIATGLIAATVVSLLWTLRPQRMIERVILLVIFGLAALCSLLATFTTLGDGDVTRHLYLLAALILSIQGVLVAAQSARIARETQKTQKTRLAVQGRI